MKKNAMALLGLSLVATSVMADDASLKKTLERMGATNVKISDSALPNFKTAVSNEGVVHISNDGRFVIQGQVFELKNGKAVDITNQSLMTDLKAQEKHMISFPAKNEKHVVNVFMDITCHYCHLLFQRVNEYNDLGITIRFLAFPRGGMNTQTARQMEAIWQSSDRVKALTDAENGNPPKEVKTPDIVKKQYELGIKFGVTGTPNMVTSEGELIAGYVEPKELLRMLNGH